jgi:hypothetical protein
LVVVLLLGLTAGGSAVAQPPAPPAASRVPGGFHTITAVAGAALGHELITPKSGGWPITFSAWNFLADRPTNLWIIPRPFPKEDGFELARHGVRVQTYRADKSGELHNVPVDRPIIVGDILVLDYDSDGYFVPQLDSKLDTWKWAKLIADAGSKGAGPVALKFGR